MTKIYEANVLIKKLIIVLFLLMLNSAAAKLIDVNTTQILVEDTNANDPLKLKQAFAQILAINTGEDILTILLNPIFLEANSKPAVKRSYFEKIDPQYLPAHSPPRYWFHLVMQQDYIQKIILQAGFSILPHKREQIMLWLVSEKNIDRNTDTIQPSIDVLTLNYGYQDQVVMYWFKRWAQALGLMITFPKIDEQDMLMVSTQSIKSLSFEAGDHSKNRYQANQNLLVYIKKAEDSIKLRSGFSYKQQDMLIKHFQQPSEDIGVALYELMQHTAQIYAHNYKIDNGKLQNHTMRIIIADIQNYNQVTQIRNYLNDLSVISEYNIVSASLGSLEMNAELMINTPAFLEIIARDEILNHDPNNSLHQLLFNLNNP